VPPPKRKVRARDPSLGAIELPSTPLTEAAERLFQRIAEEVMHGHRTLFDDLTSHERRLVLEWLADAVAEGNAETSVHDVLWEIDYHRKPPTIQEFVHSDEYMGRVASELHPKWKEDLFEIFRPGSQIFEWVLTGAIGIGKTTLACVAQAYKLCLLSCLRDPARYYGLLTDSLIIFGIYSITKRQVSDAGYFKLRGFLDSSPYFVSKYPRNRKIDSKVQFLRQKVQVVPGSQEMHALGLDLFAFMMDEVNFMRAKESKESGKMVGQAYDLYNATHTRMMSRFMRPGGTVPGMMILMSSRNAQTSFLEEHLKKVDPKRTFVSDYPLWAVKSKHLYTQPRFKVEVGDRTSRSRVLKAGETPRKEARVVEIPGEFRKRFDEDVDQALRDLAGIATFNLSPLIRDRQSVFDGIHADMRHPFSRDVVSVDYQTEERIDQFFQIDTVCRVDASVWKPKINPGAPRFVHVDIALSEDCLGIAMGHPAGTVRNERVNEDGTVSEIPNPVVIIDLMLRVSPPPGSEIDLGKVRSFLLYLSKLYNIVKISFDRFQSADSIQIMKKLGFEVGHLSVDKDDEAYVTLRSALFDRRLLYYEYGPFIDEVLDLERDAKERKVDHPVRSSKGGRGSKDVSDAVAGVVWHCTNDPLAKEAAAALELESKKDRIQSRKQLVDAAKSAVAEKKASLPGVDVGWADLQRNMREQV
jgi:hypothetical protein